MPLLRFCRPAREAWDRACNRCADYYPCLSDPVRRSSLSVKLALVTLHLVFVGVLFLFDSSLVEILKTGTWYVVVYLVLFVATIAQYFFTSGSSPGYVLDAIRVVNDSHVIFQKPPTIQKQSAPGKNGNVIISVEGTQSGRNVLGNNSTPWTKLVMDMYPPDSSIRTWTCSYCHVLQPPRAKHCHDCDKCVLQFDHHCVWLGTCIGQGNHCRFWWYIFEETALSIWTCALYISFLKDNFERAWWKDGFSILLLAILSIALLFLLLLLIFHSYLILTNQTTYELVRRRRIPYLRGIPERVYPFSQGICRNVYNFCCIRNSQYKLEALPSVQELDARGRPYTCCDVLSCRCC